MKTIPLVVEATYHTPVSKVWAAISENSEMKKWYFNLEAFEAVPGFKFEFYGDPENKKYLHLCEVTYAVYNKKLSYTWKYAEYPGNSLVSFELFEEGENTKLKLTHIDLENFPQDLKEFGRESFETGWNEILGKNLKEYLEK